MQKNVQIPISLFDDLVVLMQCIDEGDDLNQPLAKSLVERISSGIREKRKSAFLRNLYKEVIHSKRHNLGDEALINYRNTKTLYSKF